MKRILIVAYYFPPIVASGSMRPLGFCRYLEQYGWAPQVLTTETDSVYPPLAIDPRLANQVPPTVNVTYVGHANPGQNLILIRNILRAKLSMVWNGNKKSELPCNEENVLNEKTSSLSQGWISIMKDRLWNWLFLFPDPQRYWLRSAVRQMSKLPSREYPDVVLATGKPWTGLLLGKALAKKFGVPFIADFRDPWIDNPYNKREFSPALSQKAKKLEQSVLLSAAKVLTNTLELRNQFRKTYPDLAEKFLTIPNGFDVKDHSPVKEVSKKKLPPPQEKTKALSLDLYHFGTVYGARNPFPLLNAMKELFEEKQISSCQVRVHFVGIWNINDSISHCLARDLENCGLLVREPPIPHHECLEQMARADVLFILQPNSPLQIPGKLYEYLAMARPILIIGGEGATASLVERHRLGHCCSNETPSLKAILLKLVRNPGFIETPASSVVEGFHYCSLTHQLSEVLNSVCQSPNLRSVG